MRVLCREILVKQSVVLAKRRRVVFSLLAASLSATSCGSGSSSSSYVSGPAPCPSVLNPVIVITVIDAVTRQAIASASGQGSFEDGSTVQLVAVDKGLALTLFPKAGLYSLAIKAVGYQDWTKDRIQVSPDSSCPQSLQLVAELVSNK